MAGQPPHGTEYATSRGSPDGRHETAVGEDGLEQAIAENGQGPRQAQVDGHIIVHHSIQRILRRTTRHAGEPGGARRSPRSHAGTEHGVVIALGCVSSPPRRVSLQPRQTLPGDALVV